MRLLKIIKSGRDAFFTAKKTILSDSCISKSFLFSAFCLTLLFMPHLVKSEAPNMVEIKENSRNTQSPLYYPRLMKRFLENDTTLSPKEYETLYYGYTLQEDYNPAPEVRYDTLLKELYAKAQRSPAVCDTIIDLALAALADFPFDLRHMNMLIYAKKCGGKEREAGLWSSKMKSLVDVILKSGDGATPESSWWVISAMHEYDILSRLGFTAKEFSFDPPDIDKIVVKESVNKTDKIYFNISLMEAAYNQKFK